MSVGAQRLGPHITKPAPRRSRFRIIDSPDYNQLIHLMHMCATHRRPYSDDSKTLGSAQHVQPRVIRESCDTEIHCATVGYCCDELDW
jgi:hypothetical protein